ncbi:MAG: amidohydrolase [Acidobacteria bacterium]|nr:amidohydrolase [Acidobacteriota bacterium]
MQSRLFGYLFLLTGLAVSLLTAQETPAPARPATLVLLNAKVWTGEPEQPEAQAVAIRGQRIIRVGTNADVRPLIREGHTQILDLRGRLVLPGFIDNHTHFAAAGRLLLGLNLLDVNEPNEFRRRVREAARRLPAGAWLVGGDWGAYAAWAKGSAGRDQKPPGEPEKGFLPTKELIDDVSGDHPALISRFDRQAHLANSLALKAAGITRATPDPEGGEIVRDTEGEPTGLLRGEAYKLVEQVIPPPSSAQRVAEAKRALEEARRWGVTTIHDNVADFAQLELFQDLQKNNELTVRVWARMWLSEWERVRDYIRLYRIPAASGGWGDQYIRLGGLKAWVDGIMGNSTALFFEPYQHQPDNSGRLRDVMFPEGNLYRLIQEADLTGFTVTVHAIGDRANRILLDTYERVFAENPARDRRFRVVHAQVVHPDDLARFGSLGLIAEVQPYHCIDDMRWMEERIGERARGAYAFRTLAEKGARLTFGSDWPGTNASYYPVNPLLGIYAAVTRQTVNGEPAGGWFPQQKVTVEEAIRFYTLNNAYATFEENLKGSIKEGKLADLVVLDRDILTRPPEQLLETQVVYTIFDGGIIYHRAAEAKKKQ